ncbi:hypothetical protein ZOSMA_47G00120 [Zostera marina]|uniref:Uncharacterized protein n=1 Tax=Zostera marina TaxID=29655 RepID=A0A0K9NZS5_ZOSMR|nr:hypothetical protein ZOSMA_47G00120 [Zostera marina]
MVCSMSSIQDDTISTFSPSVTSCNSGSSFSSIHAWVGNAINDKLRSHHQMTPFNSQTLPVSTRTSSISAGLQEISTPTSFSTNYSLGLTDMHTKANLELPVTLSSSFQSRYSTYADRISTIFAREEGKSSASSSPKSKKTSKEKNVNDILEKITSLPSIQDQSNAIGFENLSSRSESESQTYHSYGTGSSFSLQMFQRTIEDRLESMQESFHEDVRNVHIEVIRQFHMHETPMLDILNKIKENIEHVAKEIQSLKQENQQFRSFH